MLHLVTGGMRSGKSAWAEQRVGEHGGTVTYISTARIWDDEFAARVKAHQDRRPATWKHCEAGVGLADVLQACDLPGGIILLDCLGMWLMHFTDGGDSFDHELFQQEKQLLLHALPGLQSDIVMVTNEVGWGVVPAGALSRQYVDLLGRLNQDCAALCQRVTLVASGLPLSLKG